MSTNDIKIIIKSIYKWLILNVCLILVQILLKISVVFRTITIKIEKYIEKIINNSNYNLN